MLTQGQIEFLNKICQNRWTEENDVINVDGSINILSNMNLTQIPVQFGKVTGNFDYCNNNLTTLKGCPYIVTGYFDCNSNQLTSLAGGPKKVSRWYSCEDNKLTNLIGAPKICNINFNCYANKLTSLEGCPRVIKFNLYCEKNTDLEYLWGIGRVQRNVYYDNKNKINEWIIRCMRKDIIFPFSTFKENITWVKHEQKYSLLLDAPEEIRQHFSPRILNLVDSGVYNESKILDYKKFSRLC